jgi:uncharacterized protein (DUF1697 family)
MNQLALLLRGINVGRGNPIGMAELRSALESAGFARPRTLLRSGNVVVETQLAAAAAATTAMAAIRHAFGIDVGVVVRTRAQLANLLTADPLADVVDNPSCYVATFLSEPAPAAQLDAFVANVTAPDVVAIAPGRRELLLWCPTGQSKSAAAASLAKLRLPGIMTARNWNTVTKLEALFDA